jgi:hypothetical protein
MYVLNNALLQVDGRTQYIARGSHRPQSFLSRARQQRVANLQLGLKPGGYDQERGSREHLVERIRHHISLEAVL